MGSISISPLVLRILQSLGLKVPFESHYGNEDGHVCCHQIYDTCAPQRVAGHNHWDGRTSILRGWIVGADGQESRFGSQLDESKPTVLYVDSVQVSVRWEHANNHIRIVWCKPSALQEHAMQQRYCDTSMFSNPNCMFVLPEIPPPNNNMNFQFE